MIVEKSFILPGHEEVTPTAMDLNSQKPFISLSKIPSVKELCESLGFQHASLKDTNIFMEATHSWRKNYITSTGQPATQLLRWKLPSVQRDLRLAAEAFLEHDNNSDRFWGPGRSWVSTLDLCYPEDRDGIIEFLVQVFWKQNKYLHNNSQYGSKAPLSRDSSTDIAKDVQEKGHHSLDANSNTQQKTKRKRVSGPSPKAQKLRNRRQNNLESTKPSDNSDEFDGPDDSSSSSATSGTGLKKRRYQHDQYSKNQDVERHDGTLRRTKRLLKPASYRENTGEEDTNNGLWEIAAEGGKEAIGASSSRQHFGTHSSQDPASGTDLQLRETTFSLEDSAEFHPDQIDTSNFAAPTAAMTSAKSPQMSPLNFDAKGPTPSLKIRFRVPPSKPSSQPLITSPNQTPSAHGKKTCTNITGKVLDCSAVEQQIHGLTEPQGISSVTPVKKVLPQSNTSMMEKSLLPDAKQPSVLMPSDNNSPANSHKMPSYDTTTIPTSLGSKPNVNGSSLSPQLPIPPAVITPRARIQIPLWIITREPRYTEEQWDEGKFQGPPLSAFLDGISSVTQRSHIEKIKLTLRTPFSDTRLTVHNDAEDAWIAAKGTFAEKLKESRTEARLKRIDDTVGYKILIEPFYQQLDIRNAGVEGEEDIFDW